MIPTRLNQRFNCGTVAGFKKETGEIILVADRAVYVVNDNWEVASRFVSDEGDYVVCFAAF